MDKIFTKRFKELNDEALLVKQTIRSVGQDEYGQDFGDEIDGSLFLEWTTKARQLLSSAAGKDSEYYLSFEKNSNIEPFHFENGETFTRLYPIFNAAKKDYDNGYMVSIKSLIQAEVFDNELEQADELLKSGYRLASAVIAGTVLETTLRSLCDKESLDHGKLDKMNADLAKKGIYNKLQQKQITALADIRNSAAHGKQEEFTEENVKSMIKDIEIFISTYL